MNEDGMMKERPNGKWVRVEVAEQLLAVVDHTRELEVRLKQVHAYLQPFDWRNFCVQHPEAKQWFDDKGNVL